MMPYMCDSLLDTEARYASMKYRRLSRWFDPYTLTADELIEARALVLTPGFRIEHVRALMMWKRSFVPTLDLLSAYDDEAKPLAEANALGVDQADGEAVIRAILGNFPNWCQSMPLPATRALQELRRRGASSSELAKKFGTTPERLKRWWKADMFDPLTMMPRPRELLSRNRPIRAYRRGFRATV